VRASFSLNLLAYQDDHVLSNGEINARYDFTLLLLQRAWQAPWSPASHASFQPGFRDAVKAVALCTHSLGFPHETMMTICSFFNREWWDDSRKQCWNFECLGDQSLKSIERRVAGGTVPDTGPTRFEHCPHCHVAVYCSKECRDKDYKLGHKKKCNRPPLLSRAPDSEELELCSAILESCDAPLPAFLTSNNKEPIPKPFVANHPDIDAKVENDCDGMVEDDDDDDGSWETLESEDDRDGQNEAELSKTARIHKYFKEKVYSLSNN
jgi:MYND finger